MFYILVGDWIKSILGSRGQNPLWGAKRQSVLEKTTLSKIFKKVTFVNYYVY